MRPLPCCRWATLPCCRRPALAAPAALAALAALSLAGCGSASSHSRASDGATASTASTSASPSASTVSTPTLPAAVADLAGAERPGASQFPRAAGRSLTQLATLTGSTVQLGAATGTFTPGTRRLAFGLTESSGEYIYAPTVVYIARNPSVPAQGPFLAPADPMTVAPLYRSKENAGPGGIKAIYASQIPVKQAGTYDVLALTRAPHRLFGAAGEIAVAPASPIPDVGQRAPDIATDTVATVRENLALLTTRQPPEQMHSVSLNQVLGKRPIALLFSTPEFCTSRVCGPVTDVTVALQRQFAHRIAFIHEEIYTDNQPSRGLRSQLRAFHLRTEPWLFAINRSGIIVARLEGAFGTTELAQALNAALR